MICSNSDMSLNVGLLKNKICPTNLISSLDRMRSLVGRGNATDKACLDFRKTCDHVLRCPHGKIKIWELGRAELGDSWKMGHWQAKDPDKGNHGLCCGLHFCTSWPEIWTISIQRGGKKDLRNQALKGFICRLAGGNTFWVKMKEVCHEPWAPRGWSVWCRCGGDQGLLLPLNHSQFG